MSVNIGTTTLQNSATNPAQTRHIFKTTTDLLIIISQLGTVSPGGICYATSSDGITWSSWTQIITTNNISCSATIDSNNNIYIVYSTCYFRKLTWTGSTWTIGNQITITSTGFVSGATIVIRSSGQVVVAGADTTANYWKLAYSDNDGANWTTVLQSESGIGIVAVYVIKYLTNIRIFIKLATGRVVWYEWDISLSLIGTVGTISSSIIVGMCALRISDSEIYLVGRTSNGIKIYEWNGLIWDVGTLLSDTSEDNYPVLSVDNVNTIYCFWSDYVNTNQYNIKYRRKQTGTGIWDSTQSITTDDINNIYLTSIEISSNYVYFAWTPGTSSPYTIIFDRIKAAYSNFLLKAINYKTQTSQYDFDSYLIWLRLDDFLFVSTLIKNMKSSFKLTSTLLKNISNSFLLKSYLFVRGLGSYTLKSYLIELLHQLFLTYITFESFGLISTGLEVGGSKNISNPHIINKIYTYIKDTGTAGTTIIDVNINGVSIFSNPADRITIPYNDINKFAEIEVDAKITKGDIVTVDFDQVATNTEDVSVILHLDTYTGLNPKVTNVDILDNTFLLNREHIWITDDLKFKIRFENSMDISVTPTVSLITADGTINVLTGTWSSEVIKDDTYITTNFSVDATVMGNNQLVVSGGIDRYGITMEGYHYDFRLEDFYNKISYPKYTKTATIDINFINVISRKLAFSLDGITYSSLQNFAYTKSVDITDVTIGGSTTEGIKTLYIKFINDVGYCIKTISVTYYYTAIGIWTGYLTRQISESKNIAIISITLPDDAKNIPIQKISIYQNSVLYKELNEIQKYIFTGFNITLHSNESQRQVDISTGEVILADGSYKIIAGTTLTFDVCISASRYDLIVINEAGVLEIIKGDEGEINNTLPYINEMRPDALNSELSGRKWPDLPEYLNSQILLYAVLITCNASENGDGTYYTVLSKSPYEHIDFRPNIIMFSVELTEGITQTIRIQLEDSAGRTSYKDIIVNKISELTVSPTSLLGYSNSGRTVAVKSGEKTIATKIYFKMV